MKLSEVMAGTGAEATDDVELTGVSCDSRKVEKGHLFVAIPGQSQDGAKLAGEAVKNGAVAIVAERALDVGVPCAVVKSTRKALALIAANYYGKPADELVLLAVTGTNGKTTVAHLLESMCASAMYATARIGTNGHRFAGRTVEATHTTPEPLELHRLLREMVDAGIDIVVMEVSSHAMVQERVHGLTFRAAAFTNLGRDHLDYHKDVEDYFQAKRRLFNENLASGGLAVVKGEDTYAARIYSEARGKKGMAWKVSLDGAGEISADSVEISAQGIQAVLKTPAGDIPIKSKLLGRHNLENIMMAAGMSLAAGLSRRDVQDGVDNLQGVPGRMERVGESQVIALVDYAHTDDALRAALDSSRRLTTGKVVAVFGCGGERDAGKRPLMGEAAAEGADVIVLTSDNPRTEDPEAIIAEVSPGIEKSGTRRIAVGKARSGERGYLVEPDRKAAIELAVSLASPGDVVLVAGKGHETYQDNGGERVPFDDREILAAALGGQSGG